MQSVDELIAALESAPTGTRELGVAVLEAIGCRCMRARRLDVAGSLDTEKWWEDATERKMPLAFGDEARVVTDLNFRLPGVPEGWIRVRSPEREETYWHARLWVYDDNDDDGGAAIYARAHTERLARCVAELRAVLAAKGEKG